MRPSRIKTHLVLSNVSSAVRELVEEGVKRNGATIDPKLARERFDPHLRSVWEKHKPAKGRMDAEDLKDIYREVAKETLQGAAGVGRSALWFTSEEAKALPPGLRAIYDDTAHSVEQHRAYEKALYTPFPGGKVETDLFFGRFLEIDFKRAAEKILELGGVMAKLPKLKSGKWGPFEIRTAAKGQKIEIDRKRFSRAEDGISKLTVRSGHDLLLVEWEGGSEASTVEITRYDLRDVHPDWRSVTHYKARFDDGEALVAMIMAFNHDHNHTKEEKLFQRFRYSPDLFAVAMLAKATIAATKGSPKLADAIDLVAGRPEKKAQARLPEFVNRADFIGRYRAIAAAAKKAKKEIVLDHELGDERSYVRIAGKFEKPSEEAPQKKVILVEGRGPLLIIDNTSDDIGHAIPLSSLEKGELEIFISRGASKRGKLHLDASGKAISVPEYEVAKVLAEDLIDYLPEAMGLT